MVRKLLRRHLPAPVALQKYWIFRRFGERLHHSGLWHINRHSVASASALGLFIAFLPIPFQLVLVALGAFWLRANLPLAVTLIFITNPLTMGPLFYLCYRFGTWMIRADVIVLNNGFQPDPGWLISQLKIIWWPLWAGSVTTGLILGVTAYSLVQISWICYIKHRRGALLERLTRPR